MNPTVTKYQDSLEFSKEINSLLTIGSDPSSHFLLLGDSVMDRHCRIEARNDHHIIKDLRTPNGTYVNGARILEAILQEGDVIGVGHHQLLFSRHKNNPLKMSSKNEKWSKKLNSIPSFAQTDFPVLLTGPSGAGKDLVAHEIHRVSQRKFGPFMSVNCSALTETLIESELFGHVKGSFTGAIADRKGAFETARGGTLFLDEIGDLPITLQAKLLRALENQEIRPVGSDKIVKTDVRIISATHQNLNSKILEKEFREDLFYRLNVINMNMPSLNERMEDFDDLFYGFCRLYRVRFSYGAIQELKKHNWKGNIRELKNTVAKASALFPAQEVKFEMLPELVQIQDIHLEPTKLSSRSTNVVKEFEKHIILERLKANGGNQKKTAMELGIPKSTLHDRLKAYQKEAHNELSNPETALAH